MNFFDRLKIFLKNPDFLDACMAMRCDENYHWKGSVSPAELPLLKQVVTAAGRLTGPIVEIGTLFGFTTSYICAWKPKDKLLITVDNYSWNPWGMDSCCHKAFTSRVLDPWAICTSLEQVTSDKSDFFDKYDRGAPSMVFLDAIHTYEETLRDIQWAVSTKASIIVGHDYGVDFPGVVCAVNESFGKEITVAGSLWVVGAAP